MPSFRQLPLIGSFAFVLAFLVFGHVDETRAAATITINNLDGPGEGFRSTAPPDAASTAGGNPGATLGQQRLIAFQHAADIWAGMIDSPVPIIVDAALNPQSCSATSAVLGSAGPTSVERDFANAPVANTWYAIAQANSLAGVDLDPAASDMGATFNSAIDDNPNCLTGLFWYYGLDGNPPANTINFISTVLHEIAHGMGFLSLVNVSNGSKFFGLDDAYMRHLANAQTGKTFSAMSNVERRNAMKSIDDLVWTGAAVNTHNTLTNGTHASTGEVRMYAPNPVQSGSSVSHFSTTLSPNELMEPFATGAQSVGLARYLFFDIGWDIIACGDGVVQTGEECDAAGESLTCDINCTLVSCGDGTLNATAGEQCDDGNTTSGDGCTASCINEFCGDTIIQPGLGEECDDGSETASCNADCTLVSCGDGTFNATAGEECDDGNLLNEDGCSDQCVAEFCGDGILQEDPLGEECDDGNTTSGDGCSATCQQEGCYTCIGEPSTCTIAPPLSGCYQPIVSNKATLLINDRTNANGDNLTWKWLRGERTTLADFGDPLTTTDYNLCIYDQTAGSSSLAFQTTIPAGGVCRNKPCWKKTGSSGFRYKDLDRTASGVDTVILRRGNAGRSQVSVIGRGAQLSFPSSFLPFNQDSTVIVQLSNTAGTCWQDTYRTPARRNTSTQFRDLGD